MHQSSFPEADQLSMPIKTVPEFVVACAELATRTEEGRDKKLAGAYSTAVSVGEEKRLRLNWLLKRRREEGRNVNPLKGTRGTKSCSVPESRQG